MNRSNTTGRALAIGMTPATRGEIDELLEPVRSWPERTTLPTVSEGMPGSRACPPQIDEPWCGTRQPTNFASPQPFAPASARTELTTSTNTLTRPRSFRNADLSHDLVREVSTNLNYRITPSEASEPDRRDTDQGRPAPERAICA
jgi:hypothetical protein